MPVITTHHDLLKGKREIDKLDKYSGDINVMVSRITFEILEECPGLVADVANNDADRSLLETAVIKNMDRHKYHFGLDRKAMIGKVFDYMFGYGELQKYIEDEEITDIDGTSYDEFAVKRCGERYKIPVSFGDEKTFDTYCKLVAIRNRGILNENDSHCRVSDEKYRLRINVSIKPRNVTGPSLCIRKHRKSGYSLEQLAGLGMLDKAHIDYLRGLAARDVTVVFCGKGAAGKTTLLRAFINCLPEMDRVLIAESDTEIYPEKPYCIVQKVKKKNEGGVRVTLKDLVQDGLTMTLDAYCVGEIVGDEAWDFIKAAYSGHRGMATTHARSAEDALWRLLTLSKSANIGESERTVKEMISRSIGVIIYLKNFKVAEIIEVKDYDDKNDKFLFTRVMSCE